MGNFRKRGKCELSGEVGFHDEEGATFNFLSLVLLFCYESGIFIQNNRELSRGLNYKLLLFSHRQKVKADMIDEQKKIQKGRIFVQS